MPAPNEDVPAFLRVEEWAQLDAYPSYWISDSGRVYSEHTEKDGHLCGDGKGPRWHV